MLKFDLSFFCMYIPTLIELKKDDPYNHPQPPVPHKTMAVHGAWHAALRAPPTSCFPSPLPPNSAAHLLLPCKKDVLDVWQRASAIALCAVKVVE